MGCSASRPQTLISSLSQDQHQQDHHLSMTSPSSSPSSHSPFSFSFSDSSSTTIFRTLSLPSSLVHHPPLRKGDSNHLVSLTSTTYGSLILVDPLPVDSRLPQNRRQSEPPLPDSVFRTAHIVDPSSPDTVINTWELMEGLDDDDCDEDSGFHIVKRPIEEPNSCGISREDRDLASVVESYEFVERKDTKPLWKHLSEESLLAKLDPNVVSSYRRALSGRHLGFKESNDTNPQPIPPSESTTAARSSPSKNKGRFTLPGTEDRIVLYYTSLRGIRKTYEDCCSIRMILKGFSVCVDERDISMDSSFRKELQSIMGVKAVSLPQVFIRGEHVGDADEIRKLHEAGELGRLFEGIPTKDGRLDCKSCGDARFVPCPSCNGSRKIYEEDEGRQRKCSDCNENGLVRCSSCCCF